MRTILTLALGLALALAGGPLLGVAHVADESTDTFLQRYGFGSANPKLQLLPTEDGKGAGRRLEGSIATLHSNVSTLEDVYTYVNVTWTNMAFSHYDDWIGLWPAQDDLRLFTPPIKFKPACAACVADPDHQLNPPVNGSVTFTLLNMRVPLRFVYISGNQYPEVRAQSNTVTVTNPARPQGGRLSLVVGDATKMRVTWHAGGYNGSDRSRSSCELQQVIYGTTSGKYTFSEQASTVDVPYGKKDMCDTDAQQPAGLHGWFNPPSVHTAILSGLEPETQYFYRYGSECDGYTRERNFTVPARVGPRRTQIAMFGDMGNVEIDGSNHHSWDFDNAGELPSRNTTIRVGEDTDAEIVLHIGDISYACGYLSEWDTFFAMIEPTASSKPWMPGIGNHEVGYSTSFLPGTDSGGECGVPYNSYFPFASQNPTSTFPERQPWYDFKLGSAHFVIISTEHDFSPGSTQYQWLEKVLAGADRSQTPWLVLGGHRPMYASTLWPDAGPQIRAALEALLIKYKVDVALWGHNHSFQRSCRLSNSTCVDGSKEHGVYHFVVGSAGYELNPIQLDPAPAWVGHQDNSTYGFLHMDFQSSTRLKTSFVRNLDGKVIDMFTVNRA